MNHPDSTQHQVQRAEELVSWTGREWLRFLWCRLRLTISEMNYASRRMAELQVAFARQAAHRAPSRAGQSLTRGFRRLPAASSVSPIRPLAGRHILIRYPAATATATRSGHRRGRRVAAADDGG